MNIKELADTRDLAKYSSTLAGRVIKTSTRYGMLLKPRKHLNKLN